MDPGTTPKFCKARTVLYAYRSLVNEEINRLVQQGILTPVTFSDWAAPIVPVLYSDKKSVRICGDFKQTSQYPIPKIEDLFTSLKVVNHFSNLIFMENIIWPFMMTERFV